MLTHPYFGGSEPMRWEDTSSYISEPGTITSPVHYEWHHPLSTIVQAVIDAGLVLTRLHAGDTLDRAFAQWMEADDQGRFRFPGRQRVLVPTEFTLEARRPDDR